ncbi:MAG: hypothetical protein QXO27_04230 [Candidatus Aenigmatarchaeota archaeon]
MKTKTFMLMLLLVSLVIILEIAIAQPLSQNYESATTARIVGASPADLIEQLEANKEINLEKGIYTGINHSSYLISTIVSSIFSDFVHLPSPKISDILTTIDNGKDNLLVIDPPNKISSMSKIESLEAKEFKEVSSILKRNNNLIILNSPYSGLYIPYEESFVKEISSHSCMIAPMSYSSDMFLKAFLCNMDSNTIGEAYRRARNNYYWYTNNKYEHIGLTLMSYMLYGMPNRQLKVPKVDVSSYCEGYQKFEEGNSAFSLSIANSNDNNIRLTNIPNTYEKKFEFNIGKYDIAQNGNFSVIETDSTLNLMGLLELVLPFRITEESFPLNTIITGFDVVEMSEPVDLTIENLPSFDGFNYIERECYEDEKEAGVEFSKVYTDNSLNVIARINPVQIINCTEGKFRLYKKIKYKIEYVPYSPVLIESIKIPEIVLPEQEVRIKAELKNIQTSPVDGYLTVKDENGTILNAKKISTNTGSFDIVFNAPAKEGFYTYRLDFYKGSELNESVTYEEFSFVVSTLEIALIAPEISTTSADVIVFIANNFNETIQADLNYKLIQNNNIKNSDSQKITLNPGLNTFTLTFNNLEREKIIYNVLASVSYSNIYKTASSTILTEHVPVILQGNIKIKENETLVIAPKIYDIDKDIVSWDIEDKFENWTPSFDESGFYEINITADDGIKQAVKTFLLEVENVNRPPILDSINNVTIKEGERVTVYPIFHDPDNLNNVTNDDNNLTVWYSEFFNDNGTLEADFESSGNYTVYATVFDGEATDTKTFNLVIENTNRQPIFLANNITIRENETFYINEIVYDPDNNNSVTNDDNVLTVKTDKLFDEEGKWQTSFNDSGNYTINVTVSDGEFVKSEIISISVINVNRAPQITSSAKEVYYIDENANISFEVLTSDPDEDAVETKWYIDNEEKAQANKFLFEPEGLVGEFEIKAIASDGDLTTTKLFKVVVSDVPVLLGFDGSTTFVDKNSLTSVYPFVLEKSGKAKITFKEPVDLSETVDFINTVNIDKSYVSLDSELLNALKNVPAHVIMYNVQLEKNPIIYYDEQFAKDRSEITKVCPSSICSNINLDYDKDTFEFDVTHFSTFTLNNGSQEQFDLSEIENMTIRALPGAKVDKTFVITNTGMADLDNLLVQGSFNPGFSMNATPQQISLKSGESASITLSGTLLPISEWEMTQIGELILKDNSFERKIKVYLKQDEMFNIEGIRLKSSDKLFANVEDEDIIKITSPRIDVEIDIESLYEESDNVNLENVKLEVEVENENGDDIDKQFEEFDIEPGKTVNKILHFYLPEVDGNYSMHIKVAGKVGEATYKEEKEIKISMIPDKKSGGSEITLFTTHTNSPAELLNLNEKTGSQKGFFSKLLENKLLILLATDIALFLLIIICLIVKLSQKTRKVL